MNPRFLQRATSLSIVSFAISYLLLKRFLFMSHMEWSRAYCMFPSRSRKTRAKPASRGVKMSELRDSSRGTRSEANVSAFSFYPAVRGTGDVPEHGSLITLGCSERPSQRKGECPRFRREILRPDKKNAAGNSLHIGKAFDAGGAEKIRRKPNANKPNANSFDAIK